MIFIPIKGLKLFLFTSILLFYSSSHAQYATSLQEKSPGVFILDDFEADTVGYLPHKWFDQKVNGPTYAFSEEERSSYFYEIVEEGQNKFVRYDGQSPRHLTFPLGKVENLNVYETPILSWKWRAHILPEGAREDKNDRNDAVANVYVVWKMERVLFQKVPRTIRYSWSSTLDIGKEVSRLFGNQKTIVVESGDDELGKWKNFERNIVQDYIKMFKSEPPSQPMAIMIFSDGDSTGKRAKGDVDDILLKKARLNR